MLRLSIKFTPYLFSLITRIPFVTRGGEGQRVEVGILLLLLSPTVTLLLSSTPAVCYCWCYYWCHLLLRSLVTSYARELAYSDIHRDPSTPSLWLTLHSRSTFDCVGWQESLKLRRLNLAKTMKMNRRAVLDRLTIFIPFELILIKRWSIELKLRSTTSRILCSIKILPILISPTMTNREAMLILIQTSYPILPKISITLRRSWRGAINRSCLIELEYRPYPWIISILQNWQMIKVETILWSNIKYDWYFNVVVDLGRFI